MKTKIKYLCYLSLLASAGAAAPAVADESFFSNWLDNVSATQELQPHWMTALVTVTPRLEQEFRADFSEAFKPKGVTIDNFGNGKGLELIPSTNTEIIIGVPAYEDRWKKGAKVDGWSDESFLLKYRLLTANEENGNYIVTAFLGYNAGTGSTVFTNNSYITPTIAAGKGWGTRESGFSIQSTFGYSHQVAGLVTSSSATPPLYTWNTVLQGHIGKFWPEIESSYQHWNNRPIRWPEPADDDLRSHHRPVRDPRPHQGHRGPGLPAGTERRAREPEPCGRYDPARHVLASRHRARLPVWAGRSTRRSAVGPPPRSTGQVRTCARAPAATRPATWPVATPADQC